MATIEPLRHYSPPAPALERFQSISPEFRAHPFVKWAGAKTRQVPAYDPLLPAHFETYHEPFVGAGAVFMYLAQIGRIKRTILSDLNAELIRLYRVIRDDVEALILTLSEYPYDSEFYYAMRAQDPADLSDVERAARILYLNRTCFNGLYRVNSRGQFNVPFGRYQNPTICDAANLRNAHRLLLGVEIQRWSFETVLEVVQAGDFVYMDPPTQAGHSAVRYTEYSEEAFDQGHMGKLRAVFETLDRRGCLVMLSIDNTPIVRRHFRTFDLREVPRAAGGRSRGRRGNKKELVVRNYA